MLTVNNASPNNVMRAMLLLCLTFVLVYCTNVLSLHFSSKYL